MGEVIKGHCLCGAVTVEVTGPLGEISACHCEMCTRWSGSVQMGIEVPQERVTLDGPVKTHRSSSIGERAWCDTCGTAVWFRYPDGPDAGYFELAPGLFDNAGGARLARVVYADRHPDAFSIAAPDAARVSKQDYEKTHPHLSEGTNT
ncbi:GFA family protein [Thalassorhabdomicrobium marinisediminis]|uniref:GFA family protein n=1 Tax=Thalassorhabdomicrobium marinisediminis TaxID=2170577 RepID=UPI002492E9F6|nr:GFA family protein [Thalassorhabdomicrobium marinisediminis]